MKESDKCRYLDRQQAFRSCNTHECEKEPVTEKTTERVTTTTTTTTVTPKKRIEPRVQFIQNDGMTREYREIRHFKINSTFLE